MNKTFNYYKHRISYLTGTCYNFEMEEFFSSFLRRAGMPASAGLSCLVAVLKSGSHRLCCLLAFEAYSIFVISFWDVNCWWFCLSTSPCFTLFYTYCGLCRASRTLLRYAVSFFCIQTFTLCWFSSLIWSGWYELTVLKAFTHFMYGTLIDCIHWCFCLMSPFVKQTMDNPQMFLLQHAWGHIFSISRLILCVLCNIIMTYLPAKSTLLAGFVDAAVRASDFQSGSRGFDSWPGCNWVT